MSPRHVRLVGAAIAAGCSVMASLAGCSSAGGSSGGTSLTTGIAEEPDTLDPQTTNTAVAQLILRYAGDTLVSLDPSGSGKITPGLAQSWQQSHNGLRWTFDLKPGVKFQNKDALDARAVKASFMRAMSPATKAGIAASLVKPIKDIRAVGATKVAFDLKYKYSLFLQNLANPAASIVDSRAAQKMGKQFGRKPVLSGPWSVTKWASGDHISLTRNAGYKWGPPYAGAGPAKLRTLTFRIIPDDATRMAALQSGNIQATTAVPAANMKQFASDSSYHNYEYLRPGVGLFLEFNVTKAPFNDPQVRKALNYAVDKRQMVKVALLGQGQQACGPLPPSIPGYWSGMCGYAPSYDPAKAKALLAKDGWNPGPGGVLVKNGRPLAFTLYSSATPSSWNSSSQLLQQQLKKIGVKVKIDNFEFGTLLSKAQKGEDSAHLMGYTYNTADILDLWFRSSNSGTGLNLSHVHDPHLDALITAYQRQTDPSAAQAALVKTQKAISDESLWVPLWIQKEDIATSAKLKGARLSNLGYLILNEAKFGS